MTGMGDRKSFCIESLLSREGGDGLIPPHPSQPMGNTIHTSSPAIAHPHIHHSPNQSPQPPNTPQSPQPFPQPSPNSPASTHLHIPQHSSPVNSPINSSAGLSPTTAAAAVLFNRSMLGNSGNLPFLPPHLIPAHHPSPHPQSSPPSLLFPGFLEHHALAALKSGGLNCPGVNLPPGVSLPPGALDWFTRTGLMYPRLPHDLASELSYAKGKDVQTRFPVQLAFAKFLSKIKGNF